MKQALSGIMVVAAVPSAINTAALVFDTRKPTDLEWMAAGIILFVGILITLAAQWLKQEILDGLAKGNAPQGTREQGRDEPQEDRSLVGHWHSAFYEDGERIEAFPATYCVFNWTPNGGPQPSVVARRCPHRDPRSTL